MGTEVDGAGELCPIDSWIGEFLLGESPMAISKGETLMGESVAGCTGEGGKGPGEFDWC